MKQTIDFEKGKADFKYSLDKHGVTAPPLLDIAFDLDVSGSFDDEHKDGLTQNLLNGLVPWGMVLDPDGKLDVFTFSNTAKHAHYVGEITPNTCEGYIVKNIINKVPGYNGGTDYSYVLTKNLEHFGFIQTIGKPEEKKKGLFGGLFGKKESAASTAVAEKRRSMIIFATDGVCNFPDEAATEKVLAESQARGDEMFIIFLGISNQSVSFGLLKKLAATYKNCSFVQIKDLKGLLKKTNDEINDMLIDQKLIAWLKN